MESSSSSMGGRRVGTHHQKNQSKSINQLQKSDKNQIKINKSNRYNNPDELIGYNEEICYRNCSPTSSTQNFQNMEKSYYPVRNKSHQYPDDLDRIDVICDRIEDEEILFNRNNFKGFHKDEEDIRNFMIEQNFDWNERLNRNSGSPHHQNHNHSHHQQDYSYAYYEPGVAMRHSNIPTPNDNEPGPSKPPPPNSIRALLLKTNKNQQPSSSHTRHTYTTRYGTQENIYEEISSDRLKLMTGQSTISLNQSMVEEEFRRVQNRHRRVLGELNLSVEAMLMPTTPPNDSPNEDDEHTNQDNKNSEDKKNKIIGPTDELLSPVGSQLINTCADLDSGFSGSSSGASYIGNLRYHKTVSFQNTRSSMLNSNLRSMHKSHEDPEVFSRSHTGALLKSSLKKSAEDPGPLPSTSSSNQVNTNSNCVSQNKTNKISFWRKGWRKIPGFSSTTSVNKSGTNTGRSIFTSFNLYTI